MLFLAYSTVIESYVYTHVLFHTLSIMAYDSILNIVPCAVQGTLFPVQKDKPFCLSQRLSLIHQCISKA